MSQANADPAVKVGQLWKRNPPKAQLLRVERVWEATWNLLDEALGYGRDGEKAVVARCHPVRGGKAIVIPVTKLTEIATLATQPEHLCAGYQRQDGGEE